MALTQTPEEGLKVSNAPSDGKFLQYKDSTDKLTWATVSTTDSTKMPLAGGTFTGDVTWDNGTNAGKDMVWDESDDTLKFSDDVQISLGSDRDMRLYHTGSHAYFNVVTGDLNIRTASSESAIVCTANAGVATYYNNAKKTETTNTGLTVTGTLAATAVTGDGSGLTGISGGVTTDSGTRNTLAGTNAGNSFTGTDGADAADNTFVGYDAGTAITTGDNNTAIGSYALDTCTTGGKNTAVGKTALGALEGGGEHTGIGYYALAGNTSGERNTALGVEAGITNTSGSDQVFIGYKAGNTNNGDQNIFMGSQSALYMDTGAGNVGIGFEALRCASGSATHPDNNVAIGNSAMRQATEANENTAVGGNALKTITTGSENCAFGRNSMPAILAGMRNTASGYNSGLVIDGGSNNVTLGFAAGATITSGDNNVCIGLNAGNNQVTTGDNELYIARSNDGPGNDPVWIYGSSTGECINGNNSSSWATTSDRRLKKNIVDSPKGLAEIDKLRVVNFEYKGKDEIDMSEFPLATDPIEVRVGKGKEGKVQTGFIAQEVEAVLPECIHTTTKGAKTVDTDPIVWALVKAVQELSAKVKALESA